MNKQQAAERLKEIETERQRLLEERFLEIINGAVIRVDKKQYPDSVRIMTTDGKYLFEIEENILWCSYTHVWYIFEEGGTMGYSQIQRFIAEQVKHHFKMKGVTAFPIWRHDFAEDETAF